MVWDTIFVVLIYCFKHVLNVSNTVVSNIVLNNVEFFLQACNPGKIVKYSFLVKHNNENKEKKHVF